MKRLCRCDGAIFDLDGVITQTAKVHFKAWKETFDGYLHARSRGGAPDGSNGDGYRPFTREEDYLPYVDGKPRFQGVKSFLESRDINLPYGDPSDPPDRETVCGLGTRKNTLFRELVAVDGVEVYDTTLALIRQLKEQGVRQLKVDAVVDSMNAAAYEPHSVYLDEAKRQMIDYACENHDPVVGTEGETLAEVLRAIAGME